MKKARCRQIVVKQQKKNPVSIENTGFLMVEVAGFEFTDCHFSGLFLFIGS